MITTDTTTLRGQDLYERALEELAADQRFWNQGAWRLPAEPGKWNDPSLGRCGTLMCFAGTVCDIAGGKWLVNITKNGPTIAGLPADPDLIGGIDLEFLHAEEDDDEAHIYQVRGHAVVNVEYRAARLLDLRGDVSPFYMRQDLDVLRRVGRRMYDSRA